MNFMMIVIYVNFVTRVIPDNRDVSWTVIKWSTFSFTGDLYTLRYAYTRTMCLFLLTWGIGTLTNSCNKVTTVFTSVYSRYRVQHGWASVLTEHISVCRVWVWFSDYYTCNGHCIMFVYSSIYSMQQINWSLERINIKVVCFPSCVVVLEDRSFLF